MYLGSLGHLNRGPGGTYPPMAGRTKAHNNGNSIICAINNGAYQLMPDSAGSAKHPRAPPMETRAGNDRFRDLQLLLVTVPVVIAHCFARNVRKFSPRSVGPALDPRRDSTRL